MPARASTSSRTHVALLRAINLGRRNKVSMADLRTLFATLGAEDVTTHLQSGNVVFASGGASLAELTQTIEEAIRREFGLDVTVVVRTGAEFGRISSGNPFAERGAEPAQLHVTFLAGKPDGARVRAVQRERTEPDEFRIAGREVYLHCPNGYGKTKLTNAYFEKRLGVAATTRNWNTVTKLAELAARRR